MLSVKEYILCLVNVLLCPPTFWSVHFRNSKTPMFWISRVSLGVSYGYICCLGWSINPCSFNGNCVRLCTTVVWRSLITVSTAAVYWRKISKSNFCWSIFFSPPISLFEKQNVAKNQAETQPGLDEEFCYINSWLTGKVFTFCFCSGISQGVVLQMKLYFQKNPNQT